MLLALVASAGVHRSVEGVPLPEYASGRAIMALVASAGPAARNAQARMLEALERNPPVAEPHEGTFTETSDEGPRPVKLRREGHVSVPGGILVLPQVFQPEPDGVFDLYVHFHGNTAVVRESAEAAGLDAAVVIVNLGTGSLPYEEYYSVPGTYEELLDATVAGLERRGLPHPRIRRVALGAWSAGYGAISTIAQVSKKRARLDAVLIFDGIHCGWEGGVLNQRQLRPFSDLGVSAAKGDLYFGITHSTIDPKAYASTTATADFVIAAAGAERRTLNPESDAPTYLDLESMKGAVAKRLEKRMEPTSEARRGDLHVIGYRGDTKEHHMAHLFQMGATLLPELAARWKPQP